MLSRKTNSHSGWPTDAEGHPHLPCAGWAEETCDHGNVRWIPIFCRRWTCSICVPGLKATAIARLCDAYRVAQDLHMPLKLVTLTYKDDVGTAFVLRTLQHLAQQIRRHFKTFEYARIPELTLKGRIHLHLVVMAPYIPQEMLSYWWKVSSKGSYIVDIRKVDSIQHLVRYLSKDLTKQHFGKFTYSRHFPGKWAPPKRTLCTVCGQMHDIRIHLSPLPPPQCAAAHELFTGEPVMLGPPCTCWHRDEDDRWRVAS